MLVVAPVKAAADDLVRGACDGAIVGVHRVTVEQLAAEASKHRLTAQGLTPISRIVREAIAARIADQAVRDQALVYFRPVARMPGFAPALARTLNELRLGQVTADNLCVLHDCGEDLAVLLRLYEQELRTSGFADRADRFRTAIDVLDASAHAFAGLPVLLLHTSPRSALEKMLVRKLAAASPETLALTLDHHVETIAGWLECEPASPRHRIDTPLSSLQRYLFSETDVPPQTPGPSFGIFSASGESLECVEIARRVGQLAAQGIRFDEMAVLLRMPERYAPMVAESFRRAGIEAYLAQSSRRPDPAGRALLALLHCAAERLSALRFTEYLSLAQLPESAGPFLSWERLIVNASVREGDAERWRTRLEAGERTLTARRAACEDQSQLVRLDRELASLTDLQAFVLPVIQRLGALPREALWGEWLQILGELAAATLRRSETVEELLDEMQPMADIGPATLEAVLLALEDRLRLLRRIPEQERYGRVFVGSIDDARGMSFRAVFVPGLNEGSFPARVHEDPLLLDEGRTELGLPSTADDSELLRTAVGLATEHIQLSFSRIDLVTGRARVPSFYVFEAYKAALGESPDVQALQQQARDAVHTRVDWPAPAQPEDAIDDAEFDLAQLKPAFENGVAGAAAYLNDVNPYAIPSLRMRYRRWERAWKSADGLVDLEQDAIRILERYRPTQLPWSPSALEQFAVCPYRFALRGIYHLHPAERPVAPQRMEPGIRGEIYHRTVAELFRRLRADACLPLTPELLETAEKRLDEVLDQVASSYADTLAPAIPPIWKAEVESLRTDLRGWLRQCTLGEPGWSPVYSEWSFGLQDMELRDPASQAEPVRVLGSYLLRGSVDLIEQHSGGALRVVDLKTGRIPRKKPSCIGYGEVLQPALYALAVESAMEDPVTGARLQYATLRQNYTTIPISLPEARRDVAAVLETADKWMREGFLPAAPREQAYESCDYLPVCGPYEEERVLRKPKADLQPLIRIRRTK